MHARAPATLRDSPASPPTASASSSSSSPPAATNSGVLPRPGAIADASLAPPNAETLTRLAWPPTTTSFVLRSAAHVYTDPDDKSEPLGKVLGGTRLPVAASVDGDKRCKFWLAAQPRGWVCARYARPTTRPPEAIAQPEIPRGKLLPQDYFGIKEGAPRFATEDDVRAGKPRPEPKAKATYMVTKEETIDIDGETYAKTPVGLVAVSDLYRHWPSSFEGVDLVGAPPASWPFAWVIAADRKAVTARATPDKKGDKAGTVAHRAIVPVLEEVSGFVRIADGQWIERTSVRVARTHPRPAIEGAHARWVDLDLDEQVLVAYDGDKPVFATLFSSGRRKKDTPPALYRLRSKAALTKMAAEERETSHYEVSEVPWATRFRSGLYFHAAYWHDQFGTPKSHGCVNLSPKDARWIYDWTDPPMPPGWNELEIALASAMVIRVHDAKHPDPPLFDYDREARERIKIRKKEKELREKREAAEAAAAAAEEAAEAPGSGILPVPGPPPPPPPASPLPTP